MIRRLVEGGVLTTRTARRPTGPQQRISRPVAPLNGRGTGPQSMLGQWAMVPDQRGVVGDRRSPSRPLLPFGAQSLDQPGRGNDRRKPSQPFKPFATPGPTPLPTPPPTMVTPLPAPIPLTHKKVASGAIAAKGDFEAVSGEIPPVKRAPTRRSHHHPGPRADRPGEAQPGRHAARVAAVAPGDTRARAALAAVSEATSEALSEPPSREPPPEWAPREVLPDLSEPPLREALPEHCPSRRRGRRRARSCARPRPRSRRRVTPAAAFDAVEADFFAREADLYKREAVDTFDDLDPAATTTRGRRCRPPQAPIARAAAALRKYYTAPRGRSGSTVPACAPPTVTSWPSCWRSRSPRCPNRLQQRQRTGPAGPVTGALDTHCEEGRRRDRTAVGECVTGRAAARQPEPDGGAPTGDYGETLFNAEGDDDDCKYHVTWTATAIRAGQRHLHVS